MILLIFFFFQAFSVDFSHAQLDILSTGLWTIESKLFSVDNPNQPIIDYYYTTISEREEPRVFDGEVICNTTSKDEIVGDVILDFNQDNNTLVNIHYKNIEPIIQLKFETSINGLMTSSGRFLYGNCSYFLTLLSYKAAEMTIYNYTKNEIAILKLFRDIDQPIVKPTSFSFSKLSPLLLIAGYLFLKIKKENDKDKVKSNNQYEEKGDETQSNNNDAEEQEENHEKKD